MRKLLLAFVAIVSASACAQSPDDGLSPWKIESVRADSGGTPTGVVAIGSEITIDDSGIRLSLGGASLSPGGDVTRTDTGATIELEVNGQTVELTFKELDTLHGELTWHSNGRTITAALSREADK
jgi:hypothetical protein